MEQILQQTNWSKLRAFLNQQGMSKKRRLQLLEKFIKYEHEEELTHRVSMLVIYVGLFMSLAIILLRG